MTKNDKYVVVGKLTGLINNLKNYVTLLEVTRDNLVSDIENDIDNSKSLDKLALYLEECQFEIEMEKKHIFN